MSNNTTQTFTPGDRVSNSIGQHGTIVPATSDPFGFVSKSGMVAVHIDGTPEDESFLHGPETLTLITNEDNS